MLDECPVLSEFSKRVESRVAERGWIDIVVPIVMPLIIELINRCMNPHNLERAARTGLTFREGMVLRMQCRSAVAETWLGGSFLIGRATRDLFAAIQSELRDAGNGRYGNVNGAPEAADLSDLCAEAVAEANQFA